MILRPLLLALLMSAAGGAAFAGPADGPELAGGPPPHHDGMGPPGHSASRECYRRDARADMPEASGPGRYGWRQVPCPPHGMEGPPLPPMMDRDLPPPPRAGVHESHEYYEQGQYRSYDSGDRYGYGPPPPPGWDAGPPPPSGWGEGPPPGYGPPQGYDGPPDYGPPQADDGYLEWPGKTEAY